MHEVALAQSVIRIVEEAATREGLTRVRGIRVEVGLLACVAPESLAFCFDVVAKGSAAEGATLEIVRASGSELRVLDFDAD